MARPGYRLALALFLLLATASGPSFAWTASSTVPDADDASSVANEDHASLAGLNSLAGGPPNLSGVANSGLLAVNLYTPTNATIDAELRKPFGNHSPPTTIVRTGTPPESAVSFWDAESQGRWSAILTSDRPVGSLLLTEWVASGARMFNSACPASQQLVVVPVMKDQDYRDAIVTVLNTSLSEAAEVTGTLVMRDGASTDSTTDFHFALEPGGSRTLDMVMDPEFGAIPTGSIGYLRLDADQPLAAQAMLDIRDQDLAVHGFEASDASEAAAELFAPLVQAEARLNPPSGFLDTEGYGALMSSRIELVSLGPDDTIAIDYLGVGEVCQGVRYAHPPFPLKRGASATILQNPHLADPVTGASPLPDRCTAVARIRGSGPDARLLATVLNEAHDRALAEAYRAMPLADADSRVLVPELRGGRWSSDIYLMNPGLRDVEVNLEIQSAAGSPIACTEPDCSVRIAAGEGHRWLAVAQRFGLPLATDVSAKLISDQPILAVVSERERSGQMDLTAYVGVSRAGSRIVMGGPLRRPLYQGYQPLVLFGAALARPPRPIWRRYLPLAERPSTTTPIQPRP